MEKEESTGFRAPWKPKKKEESLESPWTRTSGMAHRGTQDV